MAHESGGMISHAPGDGRHRPASVCNGMGAPARKEVALIRIAVAIAPANPFLPIVSRLPINLHCRNSSSFVSGNEPEI